MAKPIVHFGGPGAPRGTLRALLSDRVRAAPPGSSVDMVSYYFRDRRLASDLVEAQQRGVRVRVTLELAPRSAGANDAVAELLTASLGSAFRPVRHRRLRPLPRRRLHEKLYLFSDPPGALIGSFNPSSDEPEEAPETLAAIGDHDAGYNSLVELRDPVLVRALTAHARALHESRHHRFERWTETPTTLRSDETVIHCWPRLLDDPARQALRRARPPGRLRMVASHLSGRTFPAELAAAARRGVAVEVVSHASRRRFPEAAEARLRSAGVRVLRLGDTVSTPMHEKFVLLESGSSGEVLFGSFNWNEQSRWFNHELLVRTSEPLVFTAYEGRWADLTSTQ